MLLNRCCQSKSTSGFTLLEVLVVVTLVGIIGAIASPGWLNFLTQRRMTAARTDLLGALKLAQEEAQTRQQNREVIFSSTDLSVTVRNESDTTGGITTVLGDGEVTSDKFNLVAASTSLVFDHDGTVSASTPFSIKITHDDSSSQRCVIVTTLLGGLKASSDDECDNFNSDPT